MEFHRSSIRHASDARTAKFEVPFLAQGGARVLPEIIRKKNIFSISSCKLGVISSQNVIAVTSKHYSASSRGQRSKFHPQQ